jgi:lipopolysaccharide cholinephosphotransferase
MNNNNNNQKLTLKEEQSCELKILIFFDAFCKQNNIRYSLYAGTMLGAIRHKGFIPWDDDIDVILTRENYNKFISTFNSTKQYLLVNYSRNKKCTGILFSKIFDTTTVAVEKKTKPLPNEGVWLDIFPLDYVPNNAFKRKQVNLHFYFVAKLIWARSAKKPSFLYFALKIFFFWSKAQKSDYFKDLTMINLKQFKSDSKFPAFLFNDYITVEFEGHYFSCFKEYDRILKIHFGDYMTLPPIEQRHTHSMDAFLK